MLCQLGCNLRQIAYPWVIAHLRQSGHTPPSRILAGTSAYTTAPAPASIPLTYVLTSMGCLARDHYNWWRHWRCNVQKMYMRCAFSVHPATVESTLPHKVLYHLQKCKESRQCVKNPDTNEHECNYMRAWELADIHPLYTVGELYNWVIC